MSPVPEPHAIEIVGSFEDGPAEDARTEEPHPLIWGIRREEMIHLTGPDKRRRTWSAHPLLTLTLKSSWRGRNAIAKHRNRGWPPTDPNARAFPPEAPQVDPVAHRAVGHTALMAGIQRSSWPRWKVCWSFDDESLMTFTNEEVLEDLPPSNWVRITLSKSADPTKREHSRSRTCYAQARESFLVAYSKGWPKASTIAHMASQPATPTEEVEPKQGDTIS